MEIDDGGDIGARAFELYSNQKYGDSLAQIEQLIETDQWRSSWHFNKGIIFGWLNRYNDAVEAFKKANELEPQNPEILNLLALSLIRINNHDKASTILTELQTSFPLFEPAYCMMMVLYIEQQNYDKAEEIFYLASQLKDNCELCYYNVGISLFMRGFYDKAIHCFDKAKSISPLIPEAYHAIGRVYWAKGDKTKAKEYFLKDMKENNSPNLLVEYSLLLFDMGDFEQSKSILNHARDLGASAGDKIFDLPKLTPIVNSGTWMR